MSAHTTRLAYHNSIERAAQRRVDSKVRPLCVDVTKGVTLDQSTFRAIGERARAELAALSPTPEEMARISTPSGLKDNFISDAYHRISAEYRSARQSMGRDSWKCRAYAAAQGAQHTQDLIHAIKAIRSAPVVQPSPLPLPYDGPRPWEAGEAEALRAKEECDRITQQVTSGPAYQLAWDALQSAYAADKVQREAHKEKVDEACGPAALKAARSAARKAERESDKRIAAARVEYERVMAPANEAAQRQAVARGEADRIAAEYEASMAAVHAQQIKELEERASALSRAAHDSASHQAAGEAYRSALMAHVQDWQRPRFLGGGEQYHREMLIEAAGRHKGDAAWLAAERRAAA